ncbi:MAG: hypothetical protein IKX18_06535 [Muribaculaceae bacterium]|nr:hypothetical protein [Muribaculaceae bacterium]
MTHLNRHLCKHLLLLMLAMAVILPSAVLTSCGDDEPDLNIGYYMSINSKVRLNLTENDESQGTSAQPEADMLSYTIVRMREALKIAYPQPNKYGNDAAVITALDNIYKDYHAMYGHYEKNTVCVVKVYRARMDDEGVVKKSTPLKTYRFGAQPPSTE